MKREIRALHEGRTDLINLMLRLDNSNEENDFR
jgi:hypothetical protein